MSDEPQKGGREGGQRERRGPPDLTELLAGADLADPVRAEALLGLVYDELRGLAARQLRRERSGHTLQPTALVHEAYLRLASGKPVAWESRGHFFRVAARAMRQVLVDQARRRGARKRAGGLLQVTLDSGLVAEAADPCDVLGLHEALERLGAMDPGLEELIELRFFSGLTVDEAADALGVSPRKAANDWAAARLWLHRELVGP